eukprot:TRINITY_DN2198_c1_g1_i2.p4 TRINITY_DN2198_c1_g1~~TRINITY_DN2198_c1_g1_i2.p4  ORF type:complete len:138 (-),score=38.19 TRINITY_DN2198_c1_g1_i2:377-790(-)
MLRTGLIQHAFIRRVGPSEARLFVGKEPTYTEYDNLFYHDGYQQAATIAQSLGLLSEPAVWRVATAVSTDAAHSGGPAPGLANRLLFTNEDVAEGEDQGTAGSTVAGRWVNRNKLACETIEEARWEAERARERFEGA